MAKSVGDSGLPWSQQVILFSQPNLEIGRNKATTLEGPPRPCWSADPHPEPGLAPTQLQDNVPNPPRFSSWLVQPPQRLVSSEAQPPRTALSSTVTTGHKWLYKYGPEIKGSVSWLHQPHVKCSVDVCGWRLPRGQCRYRICSRLLV